VIELARGLSASALRALADLESRTVAADGGRLKLEWGTLRSRPRDRVDDLLWWDGAARGQLLGFLGLYAFGSNSIELAGMVDPQTRRQGVATQLLAAAVPLCRERGYDQALLVTPRTTCAGRLFAVDRGARLDHSEFALVMSGEPVDGPSDPRVVVRPAMREDVPALTRVLTSAFGWPPGDVLGRLNADSARTVVVELAGTVVGTARLTLDDDRGGVYGFAVDPAFQGRGIGRDVLRRVCRELRERGARDIGLEVAVDNEHALGLYTSLGFRPVSTEDYFALAVR
jgi:ribosomal protein S18 acetylase RimI-like enzyme